MSNFLHGWKFQSKFLPPKRVNLRQNLFFDEARKSSFWPGGNHADSRAFSAHSPRILRAFSARALCAENTRRMRGECAENTRRMRGECAENTRQRYAYFPRIFRAFSAHLKIKKRTHFFNFSKFSKIPKILKIPKNSKKIGILIFFKKIKD